MRIFEKAVNELKNEDRSTHYLLNQFFCKSKHELRAKVLAENRLPGVPVSISSEVILKCRNMNELLPQWRILMSDPKYSTISII